MFVVSSAVVFIVYIHVVYNWFVNNLIVLTNCFCAGVTISSLLNSLQSPANPAPSPSLSLLVQRAIVKSTRLEQLIERGRFCESHVGRWRGERVMVKIYPQKQSKIWFSETEIHQVQ